ncbi:Uncharacterised protein [Vibrio cholerae]|nr:Uncharacterised protein [Vibrio cholerae]
MYSFITLQHGINGFWRNRAEREPRRKLSGIIHAV